MHFLTSSTLLTSYVCTQNDADCFHLACGNGKLKVVQELVNRHNVDPHVVNEVSVCVCVYVCVCVSCECVPHVYASMCKNQAFNPLIAPYTITQLQEYFRMNNNSSR